MTEPEASTTRAALPAEGANARGTLRGEAPDGLYLDQRGEGGPFDGSGVSVDGGAVIADADGNQADAAVLAPGMQVQVWFVGCGESQPMSCGVAALQVVTDPNEQLGPPPEEVLVEATDTCGPGDGAYVALYVEGVDPRTVVSELVIDGEVLVRSDDAPFAGEGALGLDVQAADPFNTDRRLDDYESDGIIRLRSIESGEVVAVDETIDTPPISCG